MSSGEPKLTGVYDASQKPARPGVYLRYVAKDYRMYFRWDGARWMSGKLLPELAAQTRIVSQRQRLPWQGLDQEVTL